MKYGAMVQVGSRGFAGGGPKKANIDPATTDFDIVFVGGINATSLLKFIQKEQGDHKMAIITPSSRFIQPHTYFGVSHGHMTDLDLETATVSAQIEGWSKIDAFNKVTKFDPQNNKLHL